MNNLRLPWRLRFVHWLLKRYLNTLRLQIDGADRAKQTIRQTPVILMMWHDALLVAPLLNWITTIRPTTALISASRDGSAAAQIAHSLGVSVIAVGHTTKVRALSQACAAARNGSNVFITPDGGFRGPPRIMKPGAPFVSMNTHTPVIVITWNASRYLRLPTWDGLRLPWPWSRVHILLSDPIHPPHKDREAWLQSLTDYMHQQDNKLLHG